MEDKDEEVVIGELMRVVEERRQRTKRSLGIRRTVKEAYLPLYRFFSRSDQLYHIPFEENCSTTVEMLTY